MANHSFPRYSDVWRFCNNNFIFVMSTCRFFIRPGRGQGARGGPLLYLCQDCGGQHPNKPLLSNRENVYATTPCAEPTSVLASKTNRRLPVRAQAADKIALPKRICSIRKPQLNTNTWIGRKGGWVLYLIIHRYHNQLINSLWPGDAIWRRRTGLILAHSIAFFLTAQAIT